MNNSSSSASNRAASRLDRAAMWSAGLGVIAAFLFFGGSWGAPGPYELMLRLPDQIGASEGRFPVRAGLVQRGTASWESLTLGEDFELLILSDADEMETHSLGPGEFSTREGALPRVAETEQRVIGRVEYLGERVTVEAVVEVAVEAERGGLSLRDRQVSAETHSAPELAVRVEGGLCVRSIPCRLLIFLPEGLAGGELRFGESVDVETPPELGGALGGPWLVTAVVRVNATQGEVELWGPTPEPTRTALASIPMAHSSSYLRRGGGGEWELAHELTPESVVAEVFHQGRWAWTQSNTGSRIELSAESGFGEDSGLWRVQVRGEELREDAAGVRVIWRNSSETGEDRASALSGELRAMAWSLDELSAGVLRETRLWQTQPQEAERFVLAGLEEYWRRLPRWTYGGPQALERWEERRQHGIWLGVLVLVLLGVLLSILVFKRGQRATLEAEALMRDAQAHTGEPSGIPGRRRPVYPVLMGACLILLAFLFVAALLYSRELF